MESFAVIVEAATGVHAAGAGDLLEKVVHCRFQAKVFEGGGHQAVGDVADQLDGIVNNLFGVVDALQLGAFIKVYHVFVEVEPGGGKEGAGVVVQICGNTLSFLFLEADRGVEQHFLLFGFHFLQGALVADHFALVEDNKDNEADSQYQHSDGTEEEYQGNLCIRACLQKEHWV